MTRPSLLFLSASAAAFAVGCAHCDTCDDFPAPCTGPNCGQAYQVGLPTDGGYAVDSGFPIEPMMGPSGQLVPGMVGAGPIATPGPAADGPNPATPAPTRPSPGGSAAPGLGDRMSNPSRDTPSPPLRDEVDPAPAPPPSTIDEFALPPLGSN